ncbi:MULTISPECIES: DUF4913 domain-containing protein [unclassified Streptomyces]|uniref:DUF4913 domain-containing protein n=1 Tax=unclassified Streptomyces TaxID=2593676 RepID=UPI0024768F73|nr:MULTISPECIES: DUF4913 domain-containing protein [unclassified Streptomyces]MDH6452443.1 hypothetical protein [Streptomyces sp. SAI-119]MDH6497001.1 hypothetical protein [Streptomyces sp. SAI-149]
MTTQAVEPAEEQGKGPAFIVYMDGSEYEDGLHRLTLWVRHLLLPVYGREVTSMAPWCSSWWQHKEAVAQLYGLWMAWQELTGPGSAAGGPSTWHRDHLTHVMASLRDPAGPFAGCKVGSHRPKEAPGMDPYPA